MCSISNYIKPNLTTLTNKSHLTVLYCLAVEPFLYFVLDSFKNFTESIQWPAQWPLHFLFRAERSNKSGNKRANEGERLRCFKVPRYQFSRGKGLTHFVNVYEREHLVDSVELSSKISSSGILQRLPLLIYFDEAKHLYRDIILLSLRIAILVFCFCFCFFFFCNEQ